MNFYEARNIVIENINPVLPEKIFLSESAGRVLAADIKANYNIPMFERSPYDGYAFRSEDVPGELNIICEIKAGEDVKAGEIIDSGTAGLLASQNIFSVQVYRRPVIGIITTGSEIQELQSEILPGKIYNSSHYTLMTALKLAGFEPKFMGIVQDDAQKISDLIIKSLSTCDSLILTGGVSAGDYDKTPDALKISCAKILFPMRLIYPLLTRLIKEVP